MVALEVQKILGMSFKRALPVFIFLFILSTEVIAGEESVVVSAEVSDPTFFELLYSESTKKVLVGSIFTTVTIFVGLLLYYLLKLL